MSYHERIKSLTKELDNALSKEFLNYYQTKLIPVCGLYLIYRDERIIYVGKTSRTGKTRLTELSADYRSHTLNRKLLRLLLMEDLKTDFPPLRKESKQDLISRGVLSEEDFKALQARVNRMIRKDFRFRFYPVESDNLSPFEHFFISVLKPEMND